MLTPISSTNRRLFLVLYFFSGFAALTYEVLWTRLFTRLLGATTLAVGLVLACFMLGLAWGSRFWGRFIDRGGSPARVYAYLELGIGVYALLLPLLLKLAGQFYQYIYQSHTLPISIIQLLNFSGSFLLLLLPTMLMGGTFPVLAKFMVPDSDYLGSSISYLYGANLLGAVGGCFTAGFWWISRLGVRGTNWGAVSINILIAAVAYWVSRKSSLPPATKTARVSSPAREPSGPTIPSQAPAPAYLAPMILIISAVSGFVALVYEVVWTRIISLIINSTVYAFSTMLTTYLAGLFIGSILISKLLDKKKDVLYLFGLFEIGLGIYGLLHIPLFGRLGYAFFQYRVERGILSSWFRFVEGQFLLCAAVMLLPTILMGALFPMAAKLYHRYQNAAPHESNHIGKSMGLIFAANTGGSVLGPLAAGLLLIPNLGSQQTVMLVGLLSIVMGVTVVLVNPLAGIQKRAYTLVIALILTLISAQALRFDITFSEYAGAEGEQIVFTQEDSGSLIEVYENREGIRTLVSNRQQQEGSTSQISVYSQKKQGYLPLLLHPEPRYILGIGLGTGISLSPALNFSPKLIECVEISEGIINAARLFAKENQYVLR
jgi:spermidine synthase